MKPEVETIDLLNLKDEDIRTLEEKLYPCTMGKHCKIHILVNRGYIWNTAYSPPLLYLHLIKKNISRIKKKFHLISQFQLN